MGEQFPEVPKQFSALGSVSLAVALLQSLCTAVFAISGIRVVIGLTALAAVSGIYGPARGYHQDAIRIPMLIFAAAGALVNLGVLAWIWHLRAQGSAQWRRRELTSRQKRSERLQVALAVVTLILVGLETWTHHKMHRSGPPPAVHANFKETIPGRSGGLSDVNRGKRFEPARIETAKELSRLDGDQSLPQVRD